MDTADRKTPVTLVTGYLGAGKTTLLNNILSDPGGVRYAVIVNEIAEIGIDGSLIAREDDDLVELSNGCLCCTVRHELASAVLRLAPAYDAVLIETTGLASPEPIIASLAADGEVRTVARLNSVVTVVDARTLYARLADSVEARDQIRFADHILLNKTDLVAVEAAEAGAHALRTLNPLAVIHRTHNARAPLGALLGEQAGDLDHLNAPHVHAHNPPHGEDGHVHTEACDHDHDHAHGHLPGDISVVSLTQDAPLDGMKLTHWLDRLVAAQGPDILRAKGLLDIEGEARRIVMQIVAGTLSGEARTAWPANAPRRSQLVFIGRNLDADGLKAGFDQTLA